MTTDLPTFSQCVMTCFEDKDLMNEYRRLKNNSFGLDTRSNIEKLVDHSTNYDPNNSYQFEQEAREFFEFVWHSVYLPLLAKQTGHARS